MFAKVTTFQLEHLAFSLHKLIFVSGPCLCFLLIINRGSCAATVLLDFIGASTYLDVLVLEICHPCMLICQVKIVVLTARLHLERTGGGIHSL